MRIKNKALYDQLWTGIHEKQKEILARQKAIVDGMGKSGLNTDGKLNLAMRGADTSGQLAGLWEARRIIDKVFGPDTINYIEGREEIK